MRDNIAPKKNDEASLVEELYAPVYYTSSPPTTDCDSYTSLTRKLYKGWVKSINEWLEFVLIIVKYIFLGHDI